MENVPAFDPARQVDSSNTKWVETDLPRSDKVGMYKRYSINEGMGRVGQILPTQV